MAVNYLFFKRNKAGTVGTGFFTFDGNCPEGIKLVEVTGTMTISDGINTLNINIKNNKISMPTIVYARNLSPIAISYNFILSGKPPTCAP